MAILMDKGRHITDNDQLLKHTLFCVLTDAAWYMIFVCCLSADILPLIAVLLILLILPAFLPALIYKAMAGILDIRHPEKLSESLLRAGIWLVSCAVTYLMMYKEYTSSVYGGEDLQKLAVTVCMVLLTAGYLLFSAVSTFIHRK